MLLLTGATGFTGRYVVEELLKRKIEFKCIVRDEAKSKQLKENGIACIKGDVRDPNIYEKALASCTAIINLVSVKENHIHLLIEKALQFNVMRVISISTTAHFTKLNVESKTIRFISESQIINSELNWTILRPTMIYGAKGDRNIERLIWAIRKFPVHPLLGTGNSLIQPVYVRDLAQAIVDVYLNDATIRKIYNISGAEALSYKKAVKLVANLLQKRIYMFSIPEYVAYWLAEICYRIPYLPDIKGEQVRRLNENKDFIHEKATVEFGFKSVDFKTGVKKELIDLNLI